MEMKQVSDNCFAVLNEKNRVCDANSGLINRGGGVVIDTQSDLAHARQMIEMFGKVWPAMPRRVINTHEDADHVWGNQLFEGAEIIAHRSVPERMKHVADPKESQKLLHGVGHLLTRMLLKATHPGLVAAGRQLREDYNFDGIELVLPTTLFDERYELDLDGTEVHLIYVGPCHQVGDTIIHVPKERVVFAGDVLFRLCTPMGWTGSYEKWFRCLDLIIELDPEVIVPGHGPVCGIEGRDGDEGVPGVRPRGVEEVLRRGRVLAGGGQADRVRPVRRVGSPGTPLHERGAGVPRVPQRAARRALGFGRHLRRHLPGGEGERN